MESKICTVCGTDKPLQDYYKDKDRYKKVRYRSECKECHKRRVRETTDYDRKAQKGKEYYAANREDRIAYAAEYKRNHRDKDRQWSRGYYQRNKAKAKAKSYKRQAMLANVIGTHTDDEWQALLEKYNYTCLRCGCTDCEITVDHVIPLTKGGTNYIDNLQPLCRPCNSSKKDKYIDYR